VAGGDDSTWPLRQEGKHVSKQLFEIDLHRFIDPEK
jgi:hypothetical protein